MAKKSRSQTGIHGLIIFKHKGRPKKKKTNRYLIRKINKEDKITLINSLTPQGIYFRYSIIINNEKSESIADVNLTILFPSILKFAGSYPQTLRVSSLIKNVQDKSSIINLELNSLNGKSSELLYLHFTPSTKLGNGEFISILKYKNHDGKKRGIKSQSIRIQIENLKVTPKIISHSQIIEFSHIPGMRRTQICLGIGTNKKLNSKKIFETIEDLIMSYNFQFITKDKEKGVFWFYGSESESNNDILALSKIDSKTIEIIAYSTNLIILSQFLYSMHNKIKKLLLAKKIIKLNTKIYDLECVNCGESLPFFPKKSESIKCIKCSYKQLIW